MLKNGKKQTGKKVFFTVNNVQYLQAGESDILSAQQILNNVLTNSNAQVV